MTDFFDTDRGSALTDLLLAVASAEGRLRDTKRETLEQVLRVYFAADTLPAYAQRRIANFDPARVDVESLACRFADDPPAAHARLMALLGEVARADGVISLVEHCILARIARVIGMVTEDTLALVLPKCGPSRCATFELLRATPPPLAREPRPRGSESEIRELRPTAARARVARDA